MSISKLDQFLTQSPSVEKTIVNVDEPVIKLVIFRLGTSYFSFPGRNIKEILPATEKVFFLPGMPASVEGVVNLRGDIESVIGLNDLLQVQVAEAIEACNLGSLLVAKGKEIHTCIRVDELIDVLDLTSSTLKPPPSNLPDFMQPLVSYLFTFKGQAVTGLDLDAVLHTWQQRQV